VSDERNLYLELYRQMLFIRRFEEKVHDLFLRGSVYGSTHLCIGMEAVGVGVISALGEHDRVACTYRGHGHVIALGSSPVGLMAELTGRSNGTCGARAGSMNVVDLEHRLIGCFGIVGGSLAAATGAALSLKRQGGVAVAFFGDGTANQAYFHECINFAKVMSLPVVYVCENNQYGEYTPTEQVTPGGILARPQALGVTCDQVDGQDVWATRAAGQRAVEQARAGEGPVFVEAVTYRYSDHGRGDPVKYRPDGEMERWRERDPITVAAARLTDEHGVSGDDLEKVAASVEDELERVTNEALEASYPEPDPRATEYAA
jgi:acetoin:2,6-dichlorophenolindophenol oxidoreductase subunit alpha